MCEVDRMTRGGGDIPDILPYDRDDDLVAATESDRLPRARVYRYDDVAVVLGRGGNPAIEVDLLAVREDRIQLLKRTGGGCAVVLDPGNVIVSLALSWPGIAGIKPAFAAVSDWLIELLAGMGVPGVRRRGTSDLALEDRKIGGACIWRTRNLLHYSTTLLVDPDISLAERYLPHPPREPDYRRGRAHRDFMGSLARYGGDVGDPGAFAHRLEHAVTTRVGVRFGQR